MTIDAMRLAALALRSGDARERARAIQVAQDALDAAKAVALSELRLTTPGGDLVGIHHSER